MKEIGGSEWLFKERSTPLIPTNMLPIRMMIRKFEAACECYAHNKTIRVRGVGGAQSGWEGLGHVYD